MATFDQSIGIMSLVLRIGQGLRRCSCRDQVKGRPPAPAGEFGVLSPRAAAQALSIRKRCLDMSVEHAVCIVDWDDIEAQLQELDAYLVFTGEEDEDGEKLDEEGGIAAEYLSTQSVKVRYDFMNCCEQFAPHWQSPGKEPLERIFRILFLCQGPNGKPVVEFNAPAENLEDIDTALSPTTVHEFAEATRHIDLSGCKGLFEQYVKEAYAFQSFGEFEEYAQEWFEILQRASNENKGIVVLVYA